MPDRSRLSHRACLLALLVLPLAGAAACGDDAPVRAGGTTTTASEPTSTTSDVHLSDCALRFVSLATRDDVVAAAHAGEDLPPAAVAAFEALDADCGDELDRLDMEQVDAMVAQVDPEVVDLLGTGSPQPFDKTADEITIG